MSGWYMGRIGLETKVIDLFKHEIRPRATEQDLQRYYDECIMRLGDYADHFADQSALKRTLEQALTSRRAVLEAKDPLYPPRSKFAEHHSKRLQHALYPDDTSLGDDGYFYLGRGFLSVPSDSLIGKLRESFVQDPKRKGMNRGYEVRLLIPNDRAPAETKAQLFHEALHYLIILYQIEAKRLFTGDASVEFTKARYESEVLMQERVVQYLTDLLLEDDKDALFANRHDVQKQHAVNIPFTVYLFTAFSGGFLISLVRDASIDVGVLATISGALGLRSYRKYKKKEREILTKPAERLQINI